MRLRPHHLLCLLSYAGHGYDAAFTANLDTIVARLGRGAPVVIVAGPDDVCAPLAGRAAAHCRRAGAGRRDAVAAAAVSRLLRRPVVAGARLRLARPVLAQLRRAFAAGVVRAACTGCEWHRLCTGIAGGGFAAARLAPRVGLPQAAFGSKRSATPFMQ